MYEVQVRRPCSQPAPRLSAIGPGAFCEQCRQSSQIGPDSIRHGVITEWMPLEQAVRLAHIEAASSGGKA